LLAMIEMRRSASASMAALTIIVKA